MKHVDPAHKATSEGARYVELLWPMVPKNDVDGSFDWFAGVLTLDIEYETWLNLASAPEDVRVRAARVHSHELFHFFQFVTMAFMHEWAIGLFGLISPPVKRVQAAFDPEDFAAVKQLIANGPTLLTPQEQIALKQHFLKLDTPSESGLTTRAIMEGQAYFAERTLNYAIDASHKWVSHLVDAPQPIYRVAYDYLAFAAGYRSAYDWFSLVSSISLCSTDPPKTFERLALALAPRQFERDHAQQQLSTSAMLELVHEYLPDLEWRTALDGASAQHPAFTAPTLKLKEALEAGLFDLPELFARPAELRNLTDRMRFDLAIMFKPVPPSKLAISQPAQMSEGEVVGLFILGAVGRQLTRIAASESEAEGSALLARLAWLQREASPIILKLDVDAIRLGRATEMCKVLDPMTESDLKSKLWGRMVFRLPEEIDPDPDALVHNFPEVSGLLREVNKSLPMFPLYLLPPYGPWEWFASLVSSATKGEQANDVLRLVDHAENAIYECGESINQNPRLAARCLLDPVRKLASSYL